MVWSALPSIIRGTELTLKLFSMVLLVSLPLGLVIALLKTNGPKIVSGIIQIYISLMRGTPLLL